MLERKGRSCDYKYKILLVGDASVEKYQIIRAFAEDDFDPLTVHTKEVQLSQKIIDIYGSRVMLKIWNPQVNKDLDGYLSVHKSCWKKARGVMLVYDVRDHRSLNNIRKWVETLYGQAKLEGNPMKIMVLGNFCEMEEEREVPTVEGERFALKHGFQFYEVSHNEGINIYEAFHKLTQAILDKEILDGFRRKEIQSKLRPLPPKPLQSSWFSIIMKFLAKIFSIISFKDCIGDFGPTDDNPMFVTFMNHEILAQIG